jgi:hypothetical protein
MEGRNMSTSTKNEKIRLSRGAIIAIIVSLVILAIVAAAFFISRYRNASALPADSSQASVTISHPENMSQSNSGTPIEVNVNANGLQPFLSTELWINGVLEGVQAAPSGGLTSLGSQFSWIPKQAGNYSLIARAINKNNNAVTSPAVIVFINPPESGDQPDPEAGKVYSAVLPASPGGKTSPQPPPSGEPVSEAVSWQGSPATWVTDLTSSSAPVAPEVVASADGCKIKLAIHDLSDNEEGFAVYRQTTESPEWLHVVDLASHSGQGWIQFQENNLSGGITYYVDAFNSKGKSSSNLALVNIDPESCPPIQPAAQAPVLDLKVRDLSIEDGISDAYCYTNPGGDQWSRWPELGFITPLEPGQDAPLLGKPILHATLDDKGINPGPQSMELKLECWGWQGGKLISLGKFVHTLDTIKLEPIHVALTGLAFDILPDIINGLKYETFKLDTAVKPWISLVKDPYSVENLGYVPESDQMPVMSAFITYIPSACEDLIFEPEYKEMMCYPMPGFNAGPGGINPQPYLAWSPVGAVCKGYATKECFDTNWWEGFANKYPDPHNPGVHFNIINYEWDEYGDVSQEKTQVEQYQQAWRILPNNPAPDWELCHNGHRFFEVEMQVNTSLGVFTSTSPLIAGPCAKPLDSVQVEITFNSMDIENIDDGINDSTADNVYGQFTGRVNGQPGPTLLAGWWGGAEPDNEYMGSNGYIENLDDGNYGLANFQLCLEGPGSCNYNLYANYSYNNNKLTVTLHDGEALQLLSELYDHDQVPNDDSICNADLWVGARSIGQWASTKNEAYNLTAPGGDANCNVSVTINAIGPGQ